MQRNIAIFEILSSVEEIT